VWANTQINTVFVNYSNISLGGTMTAIMEQLSKLFGSPARVKLLRLFTFNPETVYDRDSIVKIARITPDTASRELAGLARALVIQRKTFYKEVARPGSKTSKKRKTIGWVMNPKYEYFEPLSRFMRDSLSVSETEIRKRFRGVGTVKLLVLSGFFAGARDSVLDVLIVGERLKEKQITNAIQSLEAECGKEIRYMVLSSEDYQYRRRIRDKFIRDVMDYEHVAITNKLSKV
jgi:hypothetical protein